MKRSEIIEKIQYIIGPYLEYEIFNPKMAKKIATQILDELTREGMLPPPLNKEVHDVNDSGIHYLISYKLRVNEETGDHESNWESEDE